MEDLGVSEDEGRERIARSKAWQKANVLRGKGSSKPSPRPLQLDNGASGQHRPGGFRRALTGIGASGEGLDLAPFSPWRRSGPGTASLSAAKWRQLKAGFRMMGRQKQKDTIDQTKSAELMAELVAGIPAALMLASMFQRDEHGNKRIPILLEQLKISMKELKRSEKDSGDRHIEWRIHLEYGNGITRQSWFVDRTITEFSTSTCQLQSSDLFETNQAQAWVQQTTKIS